MQSKRLKKAIQAEKFSRKRMFAGCGSQKTNVKFS